MFSNHVVLVIIKAADKPIDVYLSRGATRCDTTRTLENIGNVYLHGNGLANILSYAEVRDRHNITHDDVREIFTIPVPYK